MASATRSTGSIKAFLAPCNPLLVFLQAVPRTFQDPTLFEVGFEALLVELQELNGEGLQLGILTLKWLGIFRAFHRFLATGTWIFRYSARTFWILGLAPIF
jgi:hypothetical protein